MKKATFLQDEKGNQSLSRLVALITVCVCLLYCGVALYLGRKNIMEAAGAIAMIFGSMAAPSYVFLFAQKKTESKTEINAKGNDTLTTIAAIETPEPTP